jgi:[ribosomal protein S5]-alanine N-acetyltransferase
MLPTTMPCLKQPPACLRAFRRDDAPLIASVAADPLIPLITSVPSSGTNEAITAYLRRQHQRLDEGSGYSFAIADAETDVAVGNIGLWTSNVSTGRASTGYWIAPEYRRRGYAGTALRLLTAWAGSLEDIQRLELFVEPWNEGSWRAAEACGYQREGLLRSWQQVGAERKDMYVYSFIPRRG